MDSIKQLIIQQIITQLQNISIANGFSNNITTIDDRRTATYNASELPAISVKDVLETVTKRNNNHINVVTINISIKTLGDTSIKDSRNISADVVKAIGIDKSLNNLIQDISTLSISSFDNEQESEKVASVIIEFTVTYITKEYDQFNLA